jgi:hypothetical protein
MTDDPSWEGERRRIGPELLMVDGVVKGLHAEGVPEERVRADRFSGY